MLLYNMQHVTGSYGAIVLRKRVVELIKDFGEDICNSEVWEEMIQLYLQLNNFLLTETRGLQYWMRMDCISLLQATEPGTITRSRMEGVIRTAAGFNKEDLLGN